MMKHYLEVHGKKLKTLQHKPQGPKLFHKLFMYVVAWDQDDAMVGQILYRKLCICTYKQSELNYQYVVCSMVVFTCFLLMCGHSLNVFLKLIYFD